MRRDRQAILLAGLTFTGVLLSHVIASEAAQNSRRASQRIELQRMEKKTERPKRMRVVSDIPSADGALLLVTLLAAKGR